MLPVGGREKGQRMEQTNPRRSGGVTLSLRVGWQWSPGEGT